MSYFLQTVDTLNDWVGKVIAVFVIFMMIGVVYEVVMRHVFAAPTEWAFETTNFLLLWIAALAAGNTLKHKEHVKIDLIYGRLKPNNQAIIDLITAPLFLLFMVFFLVEGWKMAIESVAILEHTESVWGPPLYPQKIALFVGVCLIFLQGVAKIVRDLLIVTAKGGIERKVKTPSDEKPK